MKQMMILAMGLLYFSPLLGDSGKKITYNLTTKKKDKIVHSFMIVTQNQGHSIIEFIDSKGEKSVNQINTESLIPVNTLYFDKNNVNYLVTTFQWDKKTIITTGTTKKNYQMETPFTYDANGSIFYIFSLFKPEDNGNTVLHILQSKEKRVVAMYLKYVKTEEIIINGKKRQAVKYETGLENKFLSLAWPYKYYYWYDKSNRHFLKYEGPYGHDDVETVESDQ